MAAGLLLACLTVAQAQTSRAVSAASYLERGAEWAAKGDWDRAITDFNLALTFDPRLATAYNHRGIARQTKGDMEGALADFNRVIEIDPRRATAWNNRGLLRHSQGDFDGAIADFNRAIHIDPRYARAYYNRARARLANGDSAGADADTGKAIEPDPRDAPAYVLRGLARQAQADPNGAIADFNRALEIAEFITEGYIHPEGSLNGSNGVNPDGSPEFPDRVIGRWFCRGWHVGEGAHTTKGPWVATQQIFDFGSQAGRSTITTDGFELPEENVPIMRAITGGTGAYSLARGEARQSFLGFNQSNGVGLRHEIKVMLR